MEFYKKLQHMVDKSGKSKKEAIALLQLSDSSFEGLDSVTFSRWLNNKTEPSLYKQFLILRAFSESIATILTDFNKEVPESFNQLLDNIFNVIENPYHYAVIPEKEENEDQIIYKKSTLDDFAEKHTLNRNIKTYNKIKLRLNNNNPAVYEIQIKRKDNAISYLSYIKDVPQLEKEDQKYSLENFSKRE